MLNIIVRLVINAVAVWIAAQFVTGIELTETAVNIGMVVVIFGLVNALIRPVFKLLTCPLQIMTLGLFTFVINALMLMLTAYLVGSGFKVDGFVSALLGSVIISIISTILSLFLPPSNDG